MKGREVEFNQMFAQKAELMAGSHPATTPFNTKVQVCFAFDNDYIYQVYMWSILGLGLGIETTSKMTYII